jgi:hypothetical protein
LSRVLLQSRKTDKSSVQPTRRPELDPLSYTASTQPDRRLGRWRSEQRLKIVEITRNPGLAGPTARQTRHESNLTPRVPCVHKSGTYSPCTHVGTRSLGSYGELLGSPLESNTYVSPPCTSRDNTCYGLHRNRYLREMASAERGRVDGRAKPLYNRYRDHTEIPCAASFTSERFTRPSQVREHFKLLAANDTVGGTLL